MTGIVDSLAGIGVRPGTCVALVLPAGPELAVACLGVAAGAVAAPLDPAATAHELEASFDALGARAVIVPAGGGEAARHAARRRRLDLLELAPRAASPAGTFALRGARRSRADGLPAGPDERALVLRTSGTTGLAKVVPFTREQLDAAARHVVQALALTDQDRSLAVMPLFHGHGLIAGLLAPLAAGGLVVCPGRFSALRFPAWLTETRPTWYTAVPGMHRAILGRLAAGHRGVEALRFVRSASAPLPPSLMAELEATLGVPAIEAYGMTEAGHQITCNPLPPGIRKPGSVGLPVGVELRVVNDSGTSLPPSHVGDVEIRGRTVSRGVARADEWLRTGDLGYLDPEGYLFLAGRRDEMINRGGEKLAPGEIEAVLLAHPAVKDAVVVPQADSRLGEVVSGLVVLNERGAATAAVLREFAATRLAPAKVPNRIVLVSEIPREATGKVARRRLAATFGLDHTGEAAPPETDTPEDRLMAFVAGRLAARGDEPVLALTGNSSLVRSGLFDSLALVELAAWVEEESGEPLTPREATRLAACDTVDEFTAFVRGRRTGRPGGGLSRMVRPTRPRAPAGYTFTAYRPELHAQVLDLQTHLWSPDRAVNAAYFEWKYARNPYRREPLIHLACRDGEVVAMRGFFGARWEVGRPRRAVDAPCAGDLVVAPAHRRRGLVPRVLTFAHVDVAARGLAVAFNLSAGRATFLASLRTGWRTTASLELLERRLDPALEAGSIGSAVDSFGALDVAVGSINSALELTATPRPDAMAALVARRSSDGRIRHVRDARYFAWRFGNPLSRYRFLYYWHGRRLEGYLVLRAASVRQRPVSLVDWEGNSVRVRAALLEAALEWGRFPSMRAWGTTLDVPERDLLERHGFRPPVRSPDRPRSHVSTVLVRTFGSNRPGAWTLAGRRLLDLASWDLRLLYSDGV